MRTHGGLYNSPARAVWSRAVRIATEPAPEIAWLTAGVSYSGYRFSVWFGRGPHAGHGDVELALKSAGSLALSGCWRDRYDDCPDQ